VSKECPYCSQILTDDKLCLNKKCDLWTLSIEDLVDVNYNQLDNNEGELVFNSPIKYDTEEEARLAAEVHIVTYIERYK